MGVRLPEFSATDPRWVRLDQLRAMLGIKHAQMQRVRKQIGNPCEHPPESDRKPGQPVWIYFPVWWQAVQRVASTSVAADGTTEPDYDKLFRKAKYERFVGELIPVAALGGLVNEIAPEFADALERGQRISADAIEPILVAIDSAKEKLHARFNGHSDAILQPEATRHRPRPPRKKQAVSRKKPT